MAHPGQRCREEKEKHPERFCKYHGCLWRVLTLQGVDPKSGEAIRKPAKGCVDGYCPNHKRRERIEQACHACQSGPKALDCPACGSSAPHTHHDFPILTLDCEVCHGPCSAPVAVYSCACGRQFVAGEGVPA